MNDHNNTLTAEVRVPISKEIGGPAKVEEIPLPPPELWSELENSADKEPPQPETQPAAPEPKWEMATLDFVDAPVKMVPIDFSFRFAGEVVSAIPVRRLTTGEVDQFLRTHGAGFSTFEVFALMTGLPVPVLRGLVAEDGDKVAEAALDFLPRSIRQAFDFPES